MYLPCMVAARGMGRTVNAPRRSTMQRYLTNWKLMIFVLMLQLMMLVMMTRLLMTQMIIMMLMMRT